LPDLPFTDLLGNGTWPALCHNLRARPPSLGNQDAPGLTKSDRPATKPFHLLDEAVVKQTPVIRRLLGEE
jgi:hypothetical protein